MCYNWNMKLPKQVKNLRKNIAKNFKKFRKTIVIFLSILVLGLSLFNFKSLFVASIVNNRPISRLSLIRLLEKQGGKQVLENQITQVLILQEAKKQNLKVEEKEIADKIKEIEDQVKAQGSDLDSLLQAQGQTRKDLGEQIRIQLTVEKIVGKDITITEAEIKDYFDKNKTLFPKDSTLESVMADIEKDLRQQKMSEKFQPWLTDLKSKAKIHYFLKF